MSLSWEQAKPHAVASSVVTTASLQGSSNSCSTAPARRARKVNTPEPLAEGRGTPLSDSRARLALGGTLPSRASGPAHAGKRESTQPVDEDSIP